MKEQQQVTRQGNHTFIYAHSLRWEPFQIPGAEGVSWIKTLSKNRETGARTALIKYDPGFRLKEALSDWPSDAYTLEGEMTCGEFTYGPDTFHFRPRGKKYGPIHSATGITRLIFTTETKENASHEEVFIRDVKQMPWGKSYSGITRGAKTLRVDEKAGVSLLIHTGFVPGGRGLQDTMRTHNHLEEYYTLQGEIHDYLEEVDAHIIAIPGTYVCRPPFTSKHGDTLSVKTPTMNLVRRGWAGKTENFYDNVNEHSSDEKIKQVAWSE